MSLVPTGGTFRAYLDNVIAGGYTYYNAGGTGSGVLDLRNTTYYTNVFEANSIRVGYSQRAVGTLRLDDGPGGITAVQANNELHLGNGSFILDEGTDITIGTFTNGVPDTRGNLYVGYAEGGYQDGASMTLAPTGGTFSAYLNNLYVGHQSYTTAGGTSGTLDLTRAASVNDISILNFVIGQDAARVRSYFRSAESARRI